MLLREAVILAIAIIIPGGLLVYFAWKAYKVKKKIVSPLEATEAFKRYYPVRLDKYATRRPPKRRNTKNIRQA